MRHNKVFRILTLALILSLLMVAIPMTSVLAASISVSPSSGAIYDYVQVTGSGYTYSTVCFYFSSDNASVNDVIGTDVDSYKMVGSANVDSSGNVSGYFYVPASLTEGSDDESVTSGTYYVYAVYEGDYVILAKTTFTVTGTTGGESISVSPTSGTIGDNVEVEGSNFDTNSTIYIYFSSEIASVGDEIDTDVDSYEMVATAYTGDNETTFDVDFDVPASLTDGDDDEDVSSGTYYVYAVYAGEGVILARDTFSVTLASVSISPTKGAVGTEVKITGSGFDSSENITIKYDTTDITNDIEGDTETNSSGKFSSIIIIPESVKGDHTITITVSSIQATVKFTVQPKITISPTSGLIGSTVEVTGTGFAKSKDVAVTFDGSEVGTGRADTYGSFEVSFNVPEVAPGSHDVVAEDESNNAATAKFTITTNINISPVTSQDSPGYVGMQITISGSGFKPNSKVTITYASEPIVIATTTSDAQGAFSATCKVPSSKAGGHTITATDGTSTLQATFVMEAIAPAAATLLLPAANSEVKSTASFDWESVTKDVNGADEKSTPITYDLEIATDKEFTESAIILKREELTDSQYTLMEAEKFKSSEKGTFYYWRVRAIDAASNAGAWSSPRAFSVGSTFALKGGLLYAVIGIGVLLLLLIGIRIGQIAGRRSIE